VPLANRPALAAALLYAGLALVTVAPALLPGHTLSASDYLWGATPWEGLRPDGVREFGANPELADSVAAFQPFAQEVRERAPDMPLWNPHVMAGRPLHANAQSAAFSPFTLPSLVLPFWWSLGVVAALKLWCAAFGTYLLARALGQRVGGALLAGLAFGFGLYFVTWLSWPLTSVWALLPWLLLAVDRCVRSPRAGPVALLALVVALQFFGGHPESSFHCMVVAALFAVLRASREGWRSLWAVAAGLAAGGALAAVALLPFLELLRDSGDIADRAGRTANRIEARFVLALALPEYWGRPTQSSVITFINVRAFYVGALPLLLAVIALRPVRERVAVAAAGVGALLVVFGVQPLFGIVTALPGFAQAHNTRLAVVGCLALALLAGWGLDDLSERLDLARRRRAAVLAVAGVLLAIPVLVVVIEHSSTFRAVGDAIEVAWLFADSPTEVDNPLHEAVIPLAALIAWLTLAGAAVALLALRLWQRVGVTAFLAAALVLVCIDLFRAGMGYNPAIDRDRASVPATPAIRLLQEQGLARFVSTQEIPQNVIPMRFGVQEARGYDVPIVRRFDRLWRREVDPRSEGVAAGLLDIPLELREVSPRALRALRLLGVTHILQGATGRAATPPYRPEAPPPPLSAPGLTEVYSGPDARVHRLDGAMPRAWVAGAQEVVDGDEAALDAISAPRFDARATVVTEERIEGVPEGGGTEAGAAEIVEYGPEQVTVRARASRAGVLVLSDVDYPGWKAKVDGRDAPIERVDYLLRGVRLEPGPHTVEFAYEPLSWRVGLIVSVLALLALGAALARLAHQRRVSGVGRG
jgi:hypothetical protein